MGLREYIIKRITYSVMLLIFVITINFFVFMMMPGDPTQLFLNPARAESPEARLEQEQILREMWGIGEPLHMQYPKYIVRMLTWNFGQSMISRRFVLDELLYRLPYTVILMGGSAVIAAIIGITFGVLAAHKRGGTFDSASVVSSLALYSLPTFWLGLIFIIIFYVELGWFPHAGAFPREWALRWPNPLVFTTSTSPSTLNTALFLNVEEALRLIKGYFSHAFLPMLTLVLFQFGGFLLLTRATMMETLTEDYITTAQAKGVKQRTILYRHALKNASLPIITSIAITFGFMLSGAIITETVFTWPGLGTWIWRAIQTRDYPVLQGFFYIIALCVITANFIADMLYGVIDPRIKYG